MCSENKAEERYIRMRKRKAFLQSFVYYVCHIFPIKRNKIVMWTFEGSGGYACSPKYIAEEILKRNKAGETDYVIYWIVQDMGKEFPPEIKKVRDSLWARAYHLSTAKFWISNTRTFYGTIKRKDTIYFQTWHGTLALKPIGKYRGDKLSKIAYHVSKYDSNLIDYALSGSRWCTQMWPAGLIYDGNIVETGSPRCDVLFNGVNEKHAKLRKEYNLPEEAKILLYAPTFRGGSQNLTRSIDAASVTLDFTRLILALEEKFGGTWYVFLRLHPQLAAYMEKVPVTVENDRLIDVSKRPDMAEIMASTDALITDYSTVIFEGFLTGQPGFIYADDLDEYVSDRGVLMFELSEIPFSVAKSNDELVKNIFNFNEQNYKEECKRFCEMAGIIEDGHASERVVDLIKTVALSITE